MIWAKEDIGQDLQSHLLSSCASSNHGFAVVYLLSLLYLPAWLYLRAELTNKTLPLYILIPNQMAAISIRPTLETRCQLSEPPNAAAKHDL